MNQLSDPWFNQVIEGLASLPQVQVLALGGSRAGANFDEHSDYDLYVYTAEEIPPDVRRNILEPCCSYLELNNQFWETEDDGILTSGVPIDIIYRSLHWLTDHLQGVLGDFNASTGYTTCFWFNLLASRVLFDPQGTYAELKKRWQIPYPPQLKQAIIEKNLPLLRGKLPSYRGQIEKALGRQDWVSVNHRVSALFESVFDILFAVSGLPHPGEKRQVQLLSSLGGRVPQGFPSLVTGISDSLGPRGAAELLALVDQLIDEVFRLVEGTPADG